MEQRVQGFLCGAMVVLFAILAGEYWIGGGFRDQVRDDAIKAGAAYYACAPDTGKCTFTWKASQP